MVGCGAFFIRVSHAKHLHTLTLGGTFGARPGGWCRGWLWHSKVCKHTGIICQKGARLWQAHCSVPYQPTLFHTAPSRELLDCNHSRARSFKKEREEGNTMQIGARNQTHPDRAVPLPPYQAHGRGAAGIMATTHAPFLWGPSAAFSFGKEMLILAKRF